MSDTMHATYANNDALAAEVQQLRAALDAANADRDAVMVANATLNRVRRTLLERAEAAAAQLALVDEYGRCCAHDASFGNDSPSFAAWLALREERREREVQP